jgi:hypothetical protein
LETDIKELLWRSERNYFNAGAEHHKNPFFTFYRNSHYPGHPLWNVAFVHKNIKYNQELIHEVEFAFLQNEIPLIRVYCRDKGNQLNQFEESGYTLTLEKGFIWKPDYSNNSVAKKNIPDLVIQEVITDEDWAWRESKFDDRCFPDGKHYTSSTWNHFERLKVATGIMKSYLIMHAGNYIGTMSTILESNFLRLKNIYIRKQFRRVGFATSLLDYFKRFVEEEGLSGFGAVVVDGSQGMAAYEQNGMMWEDSQCECIRPNRGI